MKNSNSIDYGYGLKSIQERYGYVVRVPYEIAGSYAVFVAVAPARQIKDHFNLLILENSDGDPVNQKLTRNEIYTADKGHFSPNGSFGYSWGDHSFVPGYNEPALVEWLKSLDKIDQHSISFNFAQALTELSALGAEIRNFQGVQS